MIHQTYVETNKCKSNQIDPFKKMFTVNNMDMVDIFGMIIFTFSQIRIDIFYPKIIWMKSISVFLIPAHKVKHTYLIALL